MFYFVLRDSGASNLEELQELLTNKLMIRRLKKNVLTQLPPKQRQRIAFQLKDSNVKKVVWTSDFVGLCIHFDKRVSQHYGLVCVTKG